MPCLATDIGRPPIGKKWVHEIKLDGFRSQLHLRNGEVTIYSRGGHDWTERYRSVAVQAAQLSAKHLVIDGEMVVLHLRARRKKGKEASAKPAERSSARQKKAG